MWRKVIVILGIFLFGPKVLAASGDLVFSEIMYDVDGSDSGHEWIEFYNLGTEDLIVSNTWRFFDDAYHKISLYQGTSTIAANDFFVLVDKPENFLSDYVNFSGNIFDTVINLPNSSSTLALSFDSGQSNFVEAYYDTGWGGAGNGHSLENKDYLATSTDIWQESFVWGGTPGQTNSSQPEEDSVPDQSEEPENNQQDLKYDFSNLLINEILPNPLGSDDGEWIELYNQGTESLNLNGIKITDNSSRVFGLDADSGLDLNLSANDYLLIYKELSNISLNNSGGETLTLLDSEGNIIDSLKYDKAWEGKSYARDNQQFFWTTNITPGKVNEIVLNQPPIAQISVEDSDFLIGQKISFSGEYSYDPEEGDLDYFWEFGDGQTSNRQTIKHSFTSLGTYTIRLTVSDLEGASDTVDFLLNIYQSDKESEEMLGSEETEDIFSEIKIDLAEDDLIISEFLPNPLGSDDGEWIELYNASKQPIDLYAWQLDDIEGGSKPWIFASSTIVLAGEFLTVNRAQTKITLNNSQDTVRLLTPSGEIWQAVNYEKIPEGQSYAWDFVNHEWAISEPSFGQENLFAINESAENLIYNPAELLNFEKNDTVLVQGVVLNQPDKDTRSLYLAAYDLSQINFYELAEIYSYYKDFPDLVPGQLITVSGQISRLDVLPRVKIKSAQDIVVNDLKANIDNLEIISVEDIDEEFLGSYVKVKGVVVKKSGQNIYLASDIEEDYVLRVYNKFVLKDLDITKGDELIATGILSDSRGNFKLTPFGVLDLEVFKKVLGEKIENELIDSEDISTSTLQMADKELKKKTKSILIYIVIFLILTIIIYSIKKLKIKT